FTVDALRRARLEIGRYRHRVAIGAERDDVAELGAGLRIGRLHVRLLRPGARRVAAREHVHRARAIDRSIVLLAVAPLCAAALVWRTDGHRQAVTAEGNRIAQ